jgi:hypothetical protein
MPTLEITTKIGCGLACTLCPQDSLVKAYGNTSKRLLDFDTFKLVINKLPHHVRIDFSGFSEPFENPDCIQFLEYANGRKNPLAVYTTLVGLKSQDLGILKQMLINDRFEEFVIHLPDNYGNMRGWKLSDEYVDILVELLRSPRVTCMTMSDQGQISESLLKTLARHRYFSRIKKKLPKSSFVGMRRAGNLRVSSNLECQSLEPEVKWNTAVSCSMTPFYDHNVLLPDGRVVLCCMDYGMKHVVGNLIDQDYYDLFGSQVSTNIRSANMQTSSGLKDSCICTQCPRAIEYKPQKGTWIDISSGTSLKKAYKESISRLKRMFNA